MSLTVNQRPSREEYFNNPAHFETQLGLWIFKSGSHPFHRKVGPRPSNFIVYISLPAARCGSDGTAVVSPSRKATSSASSPARSIHMSGLRRAVYHDHLDGLYGRVDAVHIEACRFRSGAALSTKCLQGRCLGCHQGHSAFAPRSRTIAFS